MFKLFVDGGVLWMIFMTLIFIALFLAAWKAPAWVGCAKFDKKILSKKCIIFALKINKYNSL